MNTSFRRSPSPGLDALQTAGVLSALIFLVNCTFEVLVMHGLYSAQYTLISLLLWSLAVWALWEVVVMARKARIPLASLNAALCLQLGVAVLRHTLHAPATEAPAGSSALAANLDIGLAVVYGPVYLIEFLLIGKLLINTFSYAERVRANQLEEQITINQRASDALAKSHAALNHANTELACSTQAAQDANLAKSRFLATMSHEIRTPMNGILGMAQLSLMPNLKEDERRDYARTILSSGQALLTLLNDILDLSKIEAGKIQLESVVFDPVNLLSEIQALFLGAAQTKNLQLKSQWLGPANQRFQADAHRIRQMISNLVGNAIKFTTQGGVHLEAAEIERDHETVLLEFSVTDTGIGIPEDKRDLLFKPFSQTESSTTREFGGSGLGLSIVSQLAKIMGGDVGVESVMGQGSRFWFRARVKCFTEGEEARRHERATQDDRTSSVSTNQFSGRVLVVEDYVINRMVIESMLGKLGLTVTLVTDGQQAVDAIILGDQLPDLILMDLNMPVMDGCTAVTLIRQWEADGNRACLPIIALTADAFEEDRQRCLAVGMDDFLTKPIGLDALKSTLGKWLSVKT